MDLEAEVLDDLETVGDDYDKRERWNDYGLRKGF